MQAAVTPEDINEITKINVFLARKGDPVAAQFIFDRVIGKPNTEAENIAAEIEQGDGVARLGVTEGEILEMIQSIPAVLPAPAVTLLGPSEEPDASSAAS